MTTDDPKSADTVAEKLQDLTVKDEASEEKGDKKETEQKKDENKEEVKAEEKNWEPSCFADPQFMKISSFLQ